MGKCGDNRDSGAVQVICLLEIEGEEKRPRSEAGWFLKSGGAAAVD